MSKSISKRHIISFSALYVGVSLARLACAIALYEITGSPNSLVGGLIIVFLPQVVAGFFVTGVLGKNNSKSIIVTLTVCYAILALCMILAFSHQMLFLIYALLFAKGFIFGIIDPTFKFLLTSTTCHDEDIRRRLAFRQGLIFCTAIAANGLGAAWLEWGGIGIILAVESVFVLQAALTLNVLFGHEGRSNNTEPKRDILDLLKSIYFHPWLRVLYLRSISDGISIIAISAVLINVYQLPPASAGLFSSTIGIAAALGMFIAPFTPASRWNGHLSSLLNACMLPLCGIILAFAYASTDVYYFVLLYILAIIPYCLADMNIQSIPFINEPERRSELAGMQSATVAIGQITGILITGTITTFAIPELYGLFMFVFLVISGFTSLLIRKSAYA